MGSTEAEGMARPDTSHSETGLHRLFAHPGLWLAILVSVVLKLALLLTDSIPLHTDEALMYIMARHILQGERPIFYYGQSYMGTVDNYLIALLYVFLPQTLTVSRLVSVGLYAAVTGTTYHLTWRISRDKFAATAAALLIAVPSVMSTLYTSVSLGPWIEILLLNNLIWLVGWDILTGRRDGWGWWLLVGFLGGLGWWELPIIIASLVPLTVQGIVRFWKRLPWGKIGVLVGGFLLGTSPWITAFTQIGTRIVADATGRRVAAAFVDSPEALGWLPHLISPIFFQFPALFGLRPSWAMRWYLLPVGLLIVAFYLVVLWWAFRAARSAVEPESRRVAFTSLLGAWALIVPLLFVSPFAVDPSGRYVLILYPPLVMLVGCWLGRARRGEVAVSARVGKILAPAVVILIAAYHLVGIVHSAAADPRGISTQMAEIADIPEAHDADLIAFLDEIGMTRGYSNFWVMGRLAFLTQERVIMAPLLPYHEDLSYTYRDDKYPPYTQMVREADEVVYITSLHPALDEAIRARFAELGITYSERAIGPYTVFYDLPTHVTPEELGPFGTVTGNEIYDR